MDLKELFPFQLMIMDDYFNCKQRLKKKGKSHKVLTFIHYFKRKIEFRILIFTYKPLFFCKPTFVCHILIKLERQQKGFAKKLLELPFGEIRFDIYSVFNIC